MSKTKSITALVGAILIVAMLAIEIDSSSDEIFDFPILGKAEALIDLKLGHPKWFIYGLVYSDTLARRQELVSPFGIKIVAPGCLVGGPTYKRDQAYNGTVFQGLSEPARMALKTPIEEN